MGLQRVSWFGGPFEVLPNDDTFENFDCNQEVIVVTA